METWGHVPGPIVMAHTFAELGKGTMARAAPCNPPCSTQPKRIATVHIVKPLALCRRPRPRVVSSQRLSWGSRPLDEVYYIKFA